MDASDRRAELSLARHIIDRRRALDAGAKCFSHNGFDGSPITAIAREAGLSLKALYAAFPSKEDLFEAVIADPDLAGWTGFGLAVQAYQKRAGAVLDHVFALARRYDRHLMVRLVKGAYWDTEIKRAQERGLADYPVFTRKPMTDLNYIACAQRLLDARGRRRPSPGNRQAHGFPP